MLYTYKSVVGVPALEMVDDVVDVQKCGVDAVKSNAVVNSFMEHKKLTLSNSKCHKIYCGKKSLMCPELEVHKETMHETDEDKYLGDHINKMQNMQLQFQEEEPEDLALYLTSCK